MLVTLIEVGKVPLNLLGTHGFHAKAENREL